MKTPIVLVSIGLLSSSLAGLTSYFAWNSLRGVSNATPVVTTAQSQPSLVSPITSHLPPAVSQPLYRPPVNSAPSVVASPQSAAATWSQPENDYLFDLSQALQPAEYQRLNATQQLEMARQIQSWIAAGADFWSLRQQFDATYRAVMLGNYAHNREVYIRFAAERFAPSHLALLMIPPDQPYGYPGFANPDSFPYPEPWLPEDAYGQPFPPDPYGYAPYPYDLPDPNSQPDFGPGNPNPAPGYPGYPAPAPDYSESYPTDPNRPFPGPQPPAQPPQTPQPYSPPAIPNLTEVST